MTQYGSDDVILEFDNAAGTLVVMTQKVQTFNGIDIEAMSEEGHTFGDVWVEQLATGIKRGADITLGGIYDDDNEASAGPNAIFNVPGAQRTFKVTWGGTKTSSMETLIKKFRRIAERGALTKYEVTLLITGAVTEV